MKRHLEKTALPNLPKQLQPSFRAALDTGRIRSMPSQFLPATLNKTPGLIMVGDAMNMRHPLTGGGMTVALKDAVLLSKLLSPKIVPDLSDDQAVAEQLERFFTLRKQESGSVIINVLAMALYSLFAAEGEDLQVLQRGCFRYFELGGKCVSEPVGLLGGLISRPWVLFYHFFSVAFYGIYQNILDKGIIGFPKSFIQIFTVLWTACVVLLPFMYEELKWW
ncbi:squalene monooxygenase [Sugiyamaella lignohabitans]|uniref:Squalene monooxygenase n=1 Tax=Sugiyamaella lignohabitans TaxID=796027 RepID=A0A167DWK5_9ASCO|nr:squalene monooxygenase [Sugiyamaella lignohabitans]ANB13382.1 squalene monooxygenase [Sugiyamaella lignohabitans]